MKLELSKLEAAQKQLAEAIVLYFERRDPVAIHTLAAATHQILFDLCCKRGIKESLLKNLMLNRIRPEKHREWLKTLSAAENFFKHADKDPASSFEFETDATVYFIFDAVQLYRHLDGPIFPEATMFEIHFVRLNPRVVVAPEMKRILSAMDATLEPTDFKLHLQAIRLWRKFKTPGNAREYLMRGGPIPD